MRLPENHICYYINTYYSNEHSNVALQHYICLFQDKKRITVKLGAKYK